MDPLCESLTRVEFGKTILPKMLTPFKSGSPKLSALSIIAFGFGGGNMAWFDGVTVKEGVAFRGGLALSEISPTKLWAEKFVIVKISKYKLTPESMGLRIPPQAFRRFPKFSNSVWPMKYLPSMELRAGVVMSTTAMGIFLFLSVISILQIELPYIIIILIGSTK